MSKEFFDTRLLKLLNAKAEDENAAFFFFFFGDKCLSHMKPHQLEAITPACFPLNASLVLRPIDQGVVHSVKAAYHTRAAECLCSQAFGNS